MKRVLFKVNYTAQGMAGVMKEGAVSRRTFIQKAASDLGGSVVSFDYAFGDVDVFVLAEVPDEISAAALAIAVAASGAATIETVVLLSAEEMDEAIGKHAEYRAPGA